MNLKTLQIMQGELIDSIVQFLSNRKGKLCLEDVFHGKFKSSYTTVNEMFRMKKLFLDNFKISRQVLILMVCHCLNTEFIIPDSISNMSLIEILQQNEVTSDQVPIYFVATSPVGYMQHDQEELIMAWILHNCTTKDFEIVMKNLERYDFNTSDEFLQMNKRIDEYHKLLEKLVNNFPKDIVHLMSAYL